ncbi:unnamed protein product [Linum trigynum]|uniref:F-box domain-containing protein n=1 Tax=Linum trigynum TaxID=586398 RepID=A0AAV2D454_9ROSI
MQKQIPADLQLDILRRLPLAPFIVRFRCVSKSWRALLSDPSFLRHKLFFMSENSEHSSSPPPLTMMINHTFGDILVTRSVYSLHSSDTLEPRLVEADLPLDFRYYSVVGCCNGLLCFQERPRGLETNINLVLWNPTTSETKAVPPPSSTLFDRTTHHHQQHDVMHHHALGFGFDPETNDYKIVIIGRRERFRRRGNNGIYVEVYSLRNDSWSKKIDHTGGVHALSSLPVLSHPRFPPCCEGKLYWWSNTDWQGETTTRFVSFDLSREVFRTVDVANPAANNNKGWFVHSLLFVLPRNREDDSLVAVCSTDSRGSFEVWALLKLCVPESWTKLFAIPRATAEFQSFFGVSRNFVFYYYDIGIDRILVAYHLATGEVFELAVPRTRPRPQHVMDHVPSLLSLT